jgi:hypothetical protein
MAASCRCVAQEHFKATVFCVSMGSLCGEAWCYTLYMGVSIYLRRILQERLEAAKAARDARTVRKKPQPLRRF